MFLLLATTSRASTQGSGCQRIKKRRRRSKRAGTLGSVTGTQARGESHPAVSTLIIVSWFAEMMRGPTTALWVCGTAGVSHGSRRGQVWPAHRVSVGVWVCFGAWSNQIDTVQTCESCTCALILRMFVFGWLEGMAEGSPSTESGGICTTLSQGSRSLCQPKLGGDWFDPGTWRTRQPICRQNQHSLSRQGGHGSR
jgi:hypothetical protein